MSKPILTVTSKAARGMQVAIWEQTSPNGLNYSLKVSKSYKNTSGDWKTTEYFNLGDAAGLSYLLQLALIKCEKFAQKPNKEVAEMRTEQMNNEYQTEQSQSAPTTDYSDDDIPF